MPLHVSSTCAYHHEVKIALHSLWHHHTYRCDNTRGCVMQFWPPDDEHMCSKHVEAWNKLIVKQTFCASICLITEINILRCTVSKTSKYYTVWLCVCSIRYPACNEHMPHYIVVCSLSESNIFFPTLLRISPKKKKVSGHRISPAILSTIFVRNVSHFHMNAVRYKKCTCLCM